MADPFDGFEMASVFERLEEMKCISWEPKPQDSAREIDVFKRVLFGIEKLQSLDILSSNWACTYLLRASKELKVSVMSLIEKREGHLAGQEVGPGLHVQVVLGFRIGIRPIKHNIVLQISAVAIIYSVDEVAGEGKFLVEAEIIILYRYCCWWLMPGVAAEVLLDHLIHGLDVDSELKCRAGIILIEAVILELEPVSSLLLLQGMQELLSCPAASSPRDGFHCLAVLVEEGLHLILRVR